MKDWGRQRRPKRCAVDGINARESKKREDELKEVVLTKADRAVRYYARKVPKKKTETVKKKTRSTRRL